MTANSVKLGRFSAADVMKGNAQFAWEPGESLTVGDPNGSEWLQKSHPASPAPRSNEQWVCSTSSATGCGRSDWLANPSLPSTPWCRLFPAGTSISGPSPWVVIRHTISTIGLACSGDASHAVGVGSRCGPTGPSPLFEASVQRRVQDRPVLVRQDRWFTVVNTQHLISDPHAPVRSTDRATAETASWSCTG